MHQTRAIYELDKLAFTELRNYLRRGQKPREAFLIYEVRAVAERDPACRLTS